MVFAGIERQEVSSGAFIINYWVHVPYGSYFILGIRK